MHEQAFQKAYQALNEKQKEAVDTTEGPVMVVAGPGTGKTQIIALRVAQILTTTDTPPDGVLVLTFTESGVTAIKKRLAHYIGRDSYSVRVHTFHSFCNTVIQDNPDQFPRIIGGEHIDEIRRVEALRAILRSESFAEIKALANIDFYVDKISRALRELKREGFTPRDFEQLVKNQVEDFENIEDLYHDKGKYKGQMKGKYAQLERKIKKNHDLLKVLEQYDAFLLDNNLYDYEDMIIEVLKALETDNDFLLSLQESFLYILADEHQDANESQNRLLFLLSSFHEDPNLFVVGDDKQAIYRFQGASLKNFLLFTKRFPNVKTIELNINYRSIKQIIEPSFSLIRNNKTLSEDTLESAQKGTGVLALTVYDDENQELEGVAQRAEELIDEGLPAHEIAVLVRRNKDVDTLKRIFNRRGISLSLREQFGESSFARSVLAYLRAVEEPANNVAVARALFSDFINLSPREVSIAIEKARRERKLILEVSEEVSDEIKEALELLASLHASSRNENLLSTLDLILKGAGVITCALSEQDSANIDTVETLFSLAQNYCDTEGSSADLGGFLAYIDTAQEFGIDLPQRTGGNEGVNIMTTHRSKGLEFDAVFIPMLDSTHWGSSRSRDFFYIPELKALKVSEEEDKLSDERRLLFVAMTRAKKRLFLSYAKNSTEGKELMSSPFVEETGIAPRAAKNVTAEKRYAVKENGVRKKNNGGDFALYIQERFNERGLNATSVNSYLACPNRLIFQQLLRLPQPENSKAQFGTAIHAALQALFESIRKGESWSLDSVVEVFENNLDKMPMDDDMRSELQERGRAALSGYIDTYSSTWHPRIENEKNINTTTETDSGDMPLTGKLDRVETLDSGEVVVIDYKTGKVKSANHIEGNTKNSTGDYKRQLVFYSLLLERVGTPMKEGIIDFVEPNERGKYKRHAFNVSHEEKEELRATINSIADSIRSGAFVGATCGEDDCKWCELAQLIKR